MNPTSSSVRTALTRRLFPRGIPRLWCPPLTHFAARGQLDTARIRRHLQVIGPYAKGLLVPGSTGEGWEMSDADIQDLLAVVLEAAGKAGIHVLVGVLKTSEPEMLACLDSTMVFLKQRALATNTEDALECSNVVGFTVCPPKGSELSQDAIRESLGQVLDRGLPSALYQLPQVTGNEMSPATIQTLAMQYPNFYLFKDTSGQDRVAHEQLDLGGVFLVRGAEGDYARWPKSGGGPYDGFLLSTANVFARELNNVLALVDQGRRSEAQALGQRLERVIQRCFELVAGFSTGNPFTNANKVLDHVMAHGPGALKSDPPLLYSGVRLPVQFVKAAIDLLRQNRFLPDRGYLE